MTSNPPAFSNTKKLVLSAFFLARWAWCCPF